MKVVRVVASSMQTNSYLLLAEKPTIIDSGEYANIVLDNLRNHIEPKKLEYIVLTHFHHDHALATQEIKKVTNAKALIHEKDAELLTFKPDITLRGNEVLDLGSHKLKVIHTPGHTPGSICLYEPKSKSLFSGDTVFPYGGFGRTDFPGGSLREMMKSLERLSKLDVKTLYPGHGEVTSDDVNAQIRDSLDLVRNLV